MKPVVLCNIYNEANNLDDFLGSLQNQTHQEFTLVIVNDGSTDLSLDIIQHYQECLDITIYALEHV